MKEDGEVAECGEGAAAGQRFKLGRIGIAVQNGVEGAWPEGSMKKRTAVHS